MTTTQIAVDAIRTETPGCEDRLHLNNAGASLDALIGDPVVDHLELEGRIGGYEAAKAAHDRIDAVDASAARLLKCPPRKSRSLRTQRGLGTRASTRCRSSLGTRSSRGGLSTAATSWPSLQVSRSSGTEIVIIDDDEHGQIDTDQLRDTIDDRARLISLTHVPTSGGPR